MGAKWGPATLLLRDVLDSSLLRLPALERVYEAEKKQNARDGVATGKHVQTTPSTSSQRGSTDSLRQHIIVRVPDFIKERGFFLTFSHIKLF